jgi:hypothetical protein
MWEVSNPIRMEQAIAMNPAIPHVARMWVEPRSTFPFCGGMFGLTMIAAVLRMGFIASFKLVFKR